MVDKELLAGISGYATPGTLTALMGASGAGKSTLMDVICGRKSGGKITGDILINGHPKDNQSFSRVMGCVHLTLTSMSLPAHVLLTTAVARAHDCCHAVPVTWSKRT